MREDWIRCNFKDILTLKNGFAFKSDKYTENGTPVIRISDINDAIVKTTNAKKVQDEENYENYLVEFGDILIAMSGATTGKFGIYKQQNKAYQNQRVGNFKLHCDDLINKNYIYYLLYALRRQIEKDAYGGAQPNISSKKIEAMEITLAPLLEQKAIVAKIEQLFSELDNGIKNLKASHEKLKIYRQTVLKKAFDGNWELKRVKDVCENVKVGIVIKPTSYYSKTETGILAFRSANVREFKVENANWVHFTEEGHKQNHRTQLKLGDVLIVRSGYPGTSCIVTKDYVGANAIDILIATPNTQLILPEYLCAFNNSPFGKGLFSLGSRGVAQKHLNVGVYSALKIPIPPIEEQKNIVREIEFQLSICNKIEETIENSLAKSEALQQSIMKKAFDGKLLSEQELENIKNNPEYESAEALLERIKKER